MSGCVVGSADGGSVAYPPKERRDGRQVTSLESPVAEETDRFYKKLIEFENMY